MALVLELQIHELQIIAENCCYSASTKLVYNHVVFLFNSSPGYSRKQRLQTMGENSLSKRYYNRSRRMILLLYMRCRKLHVYVMKQKLFLFCLSASTALIDRCMHKFKQPFRKIKKGGMYI